MAKVSRGPNGGKRPGAGRKKGFRFPKTIEKEAAREIVRQMVTARLPTLIEAQMKHAEGLRYLVTRAKSGGKFIRVTEAMARAKQGKDEEIIEVWEKDPSVQAFTDLMNRALDKPKEQPQDVKISGELDVVTVRLALARKRARGNAGD